MQWYRSWPSPTDWAEKKLDNRPHVVDNLPKILVEGYDYNSVSRWPDDEPGFCMVEWDIALDPVSMRTFAAIASIEPAEILVSSYRYHDRWSSWIGNDGSGPSVKSRPARPEEARCDSFGFGVIYFPKEILKEFLTRSYHEPGGFTDSTFGRWYHDLYGQARLTWDVHPQHLHDYQNE